MYLSVSAPIQEGEMPRSKPATSLAVTARLPSLRQMETILLMKLSRKPQEAKDAAQSHHPKTKSHTYLHLWKQNPTTTAQHQQDHPPVILNSSTVAPFQQELP